jgi:anti-sigma regulatory factor (Ser/Thr protein kinase)
VTPTSGGSQARPRPLRLALARNVEAPGIARAAVSELCSDVELSQPAAQTLLLLVSEVVSNAVLHSVGPPDAPIGLVADVGDDVITVAVTDAGDGFVPRRRDPTRSGGGYGLYLLEKAASRWGVDGDGATRVWFELALDG